MSIKAIAVFTLGLMNRDLLIVIDLNTPEKLFSAHIHIYKSQGSREIWEKKNSRQPLS